MRSIGPEMEGGTDRRDLAHRAVSEVFAVYLHGGEDEGQSGGSHQMLGPDRHSRADALGAFPRLGVGPALVKRDALSGRIAGTGDRDRVQAAVVDVLLYPAEVEAAG